MITVTLYTRPGCHLCDEAHEQLDSLREQIPHRLVLVDIDGDPALQKKYGLEIPVVEAGPFHLNAPFARRDLQVMLSAAADRERHIEMIENSPKLAEVRSAAKWAASDWINILLARHYMTLFNLLVVAYLGLAFTAPLLALAGQEGPSNVLYRLYGFVCHQLGYRSFFLGGEQWFYPRAEVGATDVLTFEQATGLSEAGTASAVLAARDFIGNEQVGFKIALCQRDIAIYGGILIFGVLFALTGFRMKALPWYLWLALAIAPIALDGFSQLLSQPPLNFLPFRESTPALRVLTGFLFGFMTAWFGYPMVEDGMADTRNLMTAKWDRIHKSAAG